MKGKDVCMIHGGKTPIKTGLSSKYRFTDPRVSEIYERYLKEYTNNPVSVKNLIPEIVLIKSYLQVLIEKAPGTDAKLIDFVSQLVLKLSWIVEKHVKVNEGETINIKHFQAVFIATIDQVLDLSKEYIKGVKYEEFLTRLDAVTRGIDKTADQDKTGQT